jgi:CHAT domain-containing protein/tetratricopeptide (TPR) repeat protein
MLRPILCLLAAAALAPPAHAQTQDDVDAANRAARALLDAGRPAEAAEGFKRAVDLARRVYGPGHANVARVSGNLALAYAGDSRYDLAEALYREVIDNFAANYRAGRGQVTVRELGDSWLNLGGYHYDIGQWAKAEAEMLHALKIYEGDGWNGPAAHARNNLGNVYERQGRYADALKMHEASLAFRVKQFGPDDSRVGVALNNIAAVYSSAGRHDEADKFYRRSRAISDKHFGPDRDKKLWRNMAWEAVHLGRFADAEALQVLGEARAPNEGSLRMGVIKAFRGDWAAALERIDTFLRSERAYTKQVAGGLAEAEQLAYVRDFATRQMSLALSVAVARKDDAAIVAASAEWVLNGKNLLFEVMAERALLVRDGIVTGQARAADQLRIVRGQLANHLTAEGAARDAAWSAKRDQLLDLERKLSRALAAAGAQERPADWVTLAAVRKAIPAGEVLVEIHKFDRTDFADKGGPKGLKLTPWYAAWVIPAAGAGAVTLIDLGPAAPIDAGVAKLLRYVREFAGDDADPDRARDLDALKKRTLSQEEFQKREATRKAQAEAARPKAAAAFHADSLALSKLVLHPLTAATGAAGWVVSPDADLWLLPWAALVRPDGKWLIEAVTLRQAVTGRDLLPTRPADRAAQSAPLVIADPNYDRGVGPGGAVKNPAGRLPGTRREAAAIADSLKAVGAVVKLDDDATEDVLKAAKSPRFLVLATHGSFRPIDPAAVRPGFAFVDENPMLRGRLVFAGCNRARRPGEAGEDGTLFGIEVLGLDLRNTELALLSACETALGDVHAGQAGAGLRQAFQLAGARGVVSTLWSVDDRAAADISSAFFTRVAAGDRHEVALAAAIREQMAKRKTGDFAHPFYWASHTLTVRGR